MTTTQEKQCDYKWCLNTKNLDFLGLCPKHKPKLSGRSPMGEKSFRKTYGPDQIPFEEKTSLMELSQQEVSQANSLLKELTEEELDLLVRDNNFFYPLRKGWRKGAAKWPVYIAGVARAVARKEYVIVS